MGDQQSNGKNKERTLRELFENPAFYASSDAPASSDEPATGGGIGVAEPGAMDTSDQGIAVIEEFEPSSGNPTASSSPGGDPEEEPRSFVVSDRRFWAREPVGDELPSRRSSGLPTIVEKLEEELQQREKQLQDYIGQYKREKQELEDFKVRQRRELERKIDQAKTSFFREFLDLVDNLELSLAVPVDNNNYKAFQQGVAMIHQQLLGLFGRHQLERVVTVGKPFDPCNAEAIDIVGVEDAALEDRVLEELQPGYTHKGIVIRAARVRVGKVIPRSTPAAGEGNDNEGDRDVAEEEA